MKALAISMALGVILMNIFSLGNVYALKDKDDREAIVTLENVKSRDVEVTVYIFDQNKDKKIEGSPDPINETPSTVKHTFKFDNDDFSPPGITVGTEIITCIEFKNGDGEQSCLTDKFKSESQPFRVTMDVDSIRK
ncbi:MAG TPA: hypothetical protein VK250_04570 [Nitrososphaeraceae archaeon]|nr:hypothetical protein [Nitrososphaeraceae archaeon]